MEVDSLAIQITADTGDVDKALSGLFQTIARLDTALKQFAQGAETGFKNSVDVVKQSDDAAQKQAAGMGTLVRSTKEVGAQAKQTGGELEQLGNKWGGFVGGIVRRFAAPLTAALSVGAVVNRYTSDVAKIAQMSGRYTTQMEEWRKKRELLSRITREDVELYRKGKLALLDFNFAMAGLSTTIMRRLNPVVQKGVELLHGVSDWVRENENNIVRFITVLAATISTVLMPKLLKLAFNPFSAVVLGIMALALVIDDLVTYIQGGETVFGDFWAHFGTGEEILEKITTLWNTFKEGLQKVVEYVSENAKAFADFWEENKVGEKIANDLISLWERTSDSLKTVFDFLGDLWGELSVGEGLARAFSAAWDLLNGSLGLFADHLPLILAVFAAFKATSGVLSTVDKMARGFEAVSNTVKTVSGGLSLVKGRLKAVSAGFDVVRNAVVLFGKACMAHPVIAVIVLLLALLPLIIKHWDEIKEAASRCWEWICDKWGAFSEWFGGLWEGAFGAVREKWEGFTAWLSGLKEEIAAKFAEWGDAIAAPFRNAIETIKGLFEAFKSWLVNLWGEIIGTISGALDNLSAPVKKVLNKLGIMDDEELTETRANQTKQVQAALDKPPESWTNDDIAAMTTAVMTQPQTVKAKAQELAPVAESIPTASQLAAASQTVSAVQNRTENSITGDTNNSTVINNKQTYNFNAANPEAMQAALEATNAPLGEWGAFSQFAMDNGNE